MNHPENLELCQFVKKGHVTFHLKNILDDKMVFFFFQGSMLEPKLTVIGTSGNREPQGNLLDRKHFIGSKRVQNESLTIVIIFPEVKKYSNANEIVSKAIFLYLLYSILYI